MVELKEHKVYELLKNSYDECLIDYVILYDDIPYLGEESHKRAVVEAFKILNARERIENRYNKNGELLCCIVPDKMSSRRIDADEFFALPKDSYYYSKPAGSRCHSIPSEIPYWYAFLETPYGNDYLVKDFENINNILFPFIDSLEIYRWNDDFSYYFDNGKEWWGTGCWSVYDKTTQIYTIIAASLTD